MRPNRGPVNGIANIYWELEAEFKHNRIKELELQVANMETLIKDKDNSIK